MGENGDEAYNRLCEWLTASHPGFSNRLICRDVPGAGRGMFAAESVPAGGCILAIPPSSLLNPLTLLTSASNTIPAHLFPTRDPLGTHPGTAPCAKRPRLSHSQQLNTTQILTLHLLLTRDPRTRHPSAWQEYIATLPAFEGWHPLTWFYAGGKKGKRMRQLLASLPPDVRRKLDDVRRRYEGDRDLLRGVLRDVQPFADQGISKLLREGDFLWAWLNVNTRSVSLPLGIPGDFSTQNHTLVPLLDMLNHTSDPAAQIRRPAQVPSIDFRPKCYSTAHIRRGPAAHLVPGKIGFQLLAGPRGLEEGEEAMFEYGPHASGTLFAEYGFVERCLAADESEGENGERATWGRYAGMDVGWLVEGMWKEKGDEGRRGVLQAIGCWDHNIINASPGPVHPSHPLLMTLRLLHLSPTSLKYASRLESVSRGSLTYMSAETEAAVRASLKAVCELVCQEAGIVLQRLKDLEAGWKGGDGRNSIDIIRYLWVEERDVATALLKRIELGDVDW